MSNKKHIPVKNLFFMLCYAWNVLSIREGIKLQEESFNNVYNLLARLLVFGTQKLIKRGFSKSYTEQSDTLGTVRGKINISETFKLRIKKIMRCNCFFDEFSNNNSFNQIIKYTMINALHNDNIDIRLKKDIRSSLLFFNDIDVLAPTSTEVSKLIYNRNNQYYKMLINICVMFYNSTMVNEENGNGIFKDFFREEQMQRVYELFILNFYAIHLDKAVYKVHSPKINWHIDEDEFNWGANFDIETNLTDRRTDIVIENKELNYQLIIDAKYYQNMLVNKYYNDSAKTYRTSHLNQVRGYVIDSDFKGKKLGALIYPTVYSDEYDKGKMLLIHNSHILMKTLNLERKWNEIESDLLSLVSIVDATLSQQAVALKDDCYS